LTAISASETALISRIALPAFVWAVQPTSRMNCSLWALPRRPWSMLKPETYVIA
jgi:hypothetical protein